MNIIKRITVIVAVFGVNAVISSAVIAQVSVTTVEQTVPKLESLSCPIVTHSLKLGGPNDADQVTRLQTFLSQSEGLDVDANGVFDQKTEAAVKVFQKKYADVILAPWGATKASGFVHITTLKKIDEIACGQPLTLSVDEVTIIREFLARGESSSESNNISSDTQNTDDSDSVSSTSSNNLTASAVESSILGRFWGFVSNLFK